jgi:hypothetical protein
METVAEKDLAPRILPGADLAPSSVLPDGAAHPVSDAATGHRIEAPMAYLAQWRMHRAAGAWGRATLR